MRVTSAMMTESTLRNLQTVNQLRFRLQQQLTTGQRITRPSDDPAGAAQVVGHQEHLGRIEQYLRNSNAATTWLNANDQALEAVSDVLARARELAVQGANGALTAGDQRTISQELGQLLHHAVATANSMLGDRYLFGGRQSGDVPFAASGASPASVTYLGDDGDIRRQVGDHSIIAVNISGSGPFPPVFSTLIALRDRLAAGDQAAVSGLIAELDTAAAGVVAARSQAGARLNQVESGAAHLETLKVRVTEALSRVRDADFAEALVDYTSAQNLYQAALEVGGRVVQPSLLDYLR